MLEIHSDWSSLYLLQDGLLKRLEHAQQEAAALKDLNDELVAEQDALKARCNDLDAALTAFSAAPPVNPATASEDGRRADRAHAQKASSDGAVHGRTVVGHPLRGATGAPSLSLARHLRASVRDAEAAADAGIVTTEQLLALHRELDEVAEALEDAMVDRIQRMTLLGLE